MHTSRRYIVTLETPNWGDEADGIRRLRAMLKRLGRGYGLRCVDARPVTEPRTPNPNGDYSYPLVPCDESPTSLLDAYVQEIARLETASPDLATTGKTH